MRPLLPALLLAAGLALPARATHGAREIGLPLTNAEAAMAMMLANPPLPMAYFQKGHRKATGLLDFFVLQEPAGLSDELQAVSEVSLDRSMTGFGASVLADWAVADRVSLYVHGTAARLGAGTFKGRANAKAQAAIAGGPDAPGQVFQRGDSDSSVAASLGVGVNVRLIGRSADGFALNFMAGPMLLHTSGKGTASVLELTNTPPLANSADCQESYAGYECVKRTYAGSFTRPLATLGFQASVPAGRFSLNPYVFGLFGRPGEGDDNIDVDPGLNAGGGSVRDQAAFVPGLPAVALGLYATYRPWALTVNLAGSFTSSLIASTSDLTDFKMLKLQLSKSFGDFPR